MKKVWPPLVLFILAPVIGELLSGSTTPSEFFTPVGLLTLTVLYGGGALLVRELVIRWGKGWYSILLLGAAYGIIEEALMVKSFFDPLWQDIGILEYYGRWAGINWIWSIELTIYHAVISIAIPVFLTELIFPAVRRERWLGRGVTTAVTVCFTANILFGNLFLNEYSPGAVEYLLAVAAIIVLVLLAWGFPRRWTAVEASGKTGVLNPLLYWITGFAAMICFVVIFWILPDFVVLPLVIVVLAVLMLAGFFWLIKHMSGNFAAWDDIQQLALVSGVLIFFIIFTPIQEFGPNRTDDTTGMIIVGIIALVLLVLLFWKTLRRMKVTEDG
ncbi:MAG: hypothetical protein PVG61_08660 [Dehalococcoidia bacterium]|jgi:hypothetical protein